MLKNWIGLYLAVKDILEILYRTSVDKFSALDTEREVLNLCNVSVVGLEKQVVNRSGLTMEVWN